MKRKYGFRSKHSTNHALISVTEKIKYLLDNRNYVAGDFVDLEKAFDIVDHKHLWTFSMFFTSCIVRRSISTFLYPGVH